MVANGGPALAMHVKHMIKRDVSNAMAAQLDVIIVGGGIFGASMLNEASSRGLRALLLERADFGGASSWNSLRIVHGGLRYLQRMNLRRFAQSVAARRWFAHMWPNHVYPLPCLMPLYGEGMKRRGVMQAALAINEMLGASRDLLAPTGPLPHRGRVLSVQSTLRMAPTIDPKRLSGGAMWYDLMMNSPQRIIIDLISRACALGATALNYVDVLQARTHRGSIRSLLARDTVDDSIYECSAKHVINCGGPWAPWLAAACDEQCPVLSRPSLAFNLLLDRAPLSNAALAVSPRNGTGPMYFLVPLRGRLLAGTSHEPWYGTPCDPRPTHRQVTAMLDGLNRCIPGIALTDDDVLRVFSGLLPTPRIGSREPTTREVVWDHARHNGPSGMTSICGVKFTTAPMVARRVISRLFPTSQFRIVDDRILPARDLDLLEPDEFLDLSATRADNIIGKLISEESVVTLEDLTHRRTDWLVDPRRSEAVMNRLKSLPSVTAMLRAGGQLGQAEERNGVHPAQGADR